MTIAPDIGPLGPDDLDAALALSTAEGWNQTPADWRRLLDLDAAGCFAARAGGRLIGTVTTASYAPALAWIGMMIVGRNSRRHGVGAALMRHAIDRLRGMGVATVMLDVTPAGRPLYESLGFTPEAEIERWQGAARPAAGDVAWPAGHHGPLTMLDREAWGVDRSRLLGRLVAEAAGEPLVADGAEAQGFALARPGRLATFLGPLIATHPGAAVRLLDAMLERFADHEVCLDLHRGGLLEPAALAPRGLALQRGLLRMRLGPPVRCGASRRICASAGPEYG